MEPVTGEWNRTVAPSDVVTFTDCPAAYLRRIEGDRETRPATSDAIGQAVHEQIAKPKQERVRDVTKLLFDVPVTERKKAAGEAKSLLRTADRVERYEKKRRRVIVKEKTIVWLDTRTGIYWVSKSDRMSIGSDAAGEYLAVDDTKTGKFRHRLHPAAAFMHGYIAMQVKALEFEGERVRVRLEYLRDSEGRRLSKPEYKIETIRAKLTDDQKQRLWGIESTISKLEEAWRLQRFKVCAGNHCLACDYCQDCPRGKEFLEALEDAKVQADETSAQ